MNDDIAVTRSDAGDNEIPFTEVRKAGFAENTAKRGGQGRYDGPAPI